MAVVIRPPFWVPRPSDDFAWNAAPVKSPIIAFLTEQKIYGKGGQVPTKQWSPFYAYNSSDPPPWTLKIEWMNSGVIQQLTKPKIYGAPGQVPTKRWEPYYDYNSSESFWNIPPNGSWALRNLTQQKIYRAGGQVTPFRWNYTLDDPPVWTGVPIGPLDTLYGVNKPVKPIPWQLNYDDASGWQGEPQGTSLALIALQPAAQSPQMSPFWAPRPPDDNIWNTISVASPINILTANTPTKRFRWNYTIDDPAAWSGEPINSAAIQLLTAVKFYGQGGQAPTFTFRFGLDDPAYWQGAPIARNATLYLATPFTNRKTYWYSEDPVWSGEPINSAVIQILTAAGQVKQAHWNYTLDDAAVWTGSPDGVPLTMTAVPFTIRPPTWYSEDAGWQGEPINSATIQLLTAAGKPKPFRWNYTLDEAPQWQGSPEAANFALFASLAQKPRVPPIPVWYSEDAAWLGSPSPSAIIPILTAGGKPPTPRYQFNYDDASLWPGVPSRSEIIRLLTFGGKPAKSRPPQWYSEDAAWTGEPIAPSFTLLNTAPPPVSTLVMRPSIWVPRPQSDHLWQTTISYNVTLNTTPLLSNLTPTKRRPPQWCSEDAYWQPPSITLNLNLFLGTFDPGAISFYVNTPLDDPTWQPQPPYNISIFGGPPQKPIKLRQPQFYSEDAFWQGIPYRSEIIRQLTASGKPPTPRYQFNYDDASSWQGVPARSEIIRLLTAAGKPPTPRYQFNYDDASLWTGAPIAISPYRLVLNLPTKARPPQFYSEDAYWLCTPVGSAIIPILTAAGKPPTPRYQFNYDDASLWLAAPTAPNINLVSLNPFTIRQPQWYSEDALWSGTPVGRNTPLYLAEPFSIRQAITYFEESLWQGRPVARNTPLYLVEPFSIRQSVTYFEDSLWTWQARRSSVISLLTVGGKVKPFRPNFTYDDAASWVPTVRENLILLTTKIEDPRKLSSLWFNAHMFYDIDAPGWPGYPIAAFRSGVPPPPPPHLQFFEWIIRARRRGRR